MHGPHGIGHGTQAYENERDGKASTIHGCGIKTPEQEHNRNTDAREQNKGVLGCQPGIWGHPGYHFSNRRVYSILRASR